VRRLPITVRLTVVFAAVMAVVLAATGIFVSLRVRDDLDRSLKQALRSRADDVAAFVQRSGTTARGLEEERLTDTGESVAQIVDVGGRVLGGTPEARDRPLLDPEDLDEATEETVVTGPRRMPALDDDPLRLLGTPVTVGDRRLVVIVGASTEDRDEALHGLISQLLIGGPVALLLATLTAFGVAHAALRPVESMRRQATAISGAEPGRRLPLPPTRDELSRLGETLNAMLARLEDALARERAFVSDASHELRTPLAILQGELELAMEEGRSPGELRAAVRSAAEETDRLARIAEDLLVIARSEEGRLPVRLQPADVNEILATVRDRFARRARNLGGSLTAEAPPDQRVVADRLRLEQALGNLVDNALRHGGGRVELSAEPRDGHVELHVRDDGPGFAPEFLDRAFERFSRADDARARGGAGLGLAVVAGIAEAHGGSAHAANRTGGGADVWLSLASPSGTAPGPEAAGGRERRDA
jgi:heavy metal sensor kinase